MYKRLFTARRVRWAKMGVALSALVCLLMAFGKDADLFVGIFSEQSKVWVPAITAVFVLTWLNLYCEVRKWFTLLGAQGLSLAEGFRQVLSGMSSGFITPNRLGEFAGRMLFLPKPYRAIAPVSALAGSSIQGAVTFLLGLVAVWVFPVFPDEATQVKFPYIGMILLIITVLLLLLSRRLRIRLMQFLGKSVDHMRRLPAHRWMTAAFWAAMRYAVFAVQFVLTLYILGFDGGPILAFAGVFLLYFCQSFIPGPAFGELGIREVLAIIIFGPFMPHPVLAAAAGFTVWLANIAIPVVAGASLVGYSARYGRG